MVELFLTGWFVFSALVGFLNYKRGNSFFTAFFISILLSPVIGLLIVILTKRKKNKRKKN